MVKPKPRARKKQKRTSKVSELQVKVSIPRATREYIKKHYGVSPRGQIAKALGIDKVTLNLMIMQMELRGSEQG